MLGKNYSILTVRRRRSCLLRFVVVLLCIGLFLQIKPYVLNSSFGQIFINDTPCVNRSYSKPVLNCSGEPLRKWCQNHVRFCNDCLIVYNNLFVLTRSALLQPKLAKGKRIGGEKMEEVLNQPESDEYFDFKQDFLQLPCSVRKLNVELPTSHLVGIFTKLNSGQPSSNIQRIDETTIAVRRQDYVNFYHTMTDIFTSYLLCRFFQYDPKTVRILFIDAHPQGNLDLLWTKMFHSFTRLGHLKNSSSIEYRELIWAQPQPWSAIDIDRNQGTPPSFFEEFREHILKQFDIPYQSNSNVNCQSLNIFFLVRHNYVAHPRNPTGKVTRQLPNEKEVLNQLKNKFAQHSNINFTSNHFEEFPFVEQLKTIVETDVFVGIHGAGLTHVVFLKNNRILIELTPPKRTGYHFSALAAMHHTNYLDCSLADGPPPVSAERIYQCIMKKILEICPSTSVTVTNTVITATSSISTANMLNSTVNS